METKANGFTDKLKIEFDKIINESVLIWKLRSCPVPPPHRIKERAIKDLASTNGCRFFIETGTYTGEMINSQLNNFDYISSVELSDYYYRQAKMKFNGVDKVHLYLGDSSEVLRDMINDLPSKDGVCFWLDGHYSEGKTACGEKETPIMRELDVVLSDVDSGVILIDDARCFVGQNDYPTIESLKEFVYSKGKSIRSFEIRDDIIRILI